MTQINNSLPGFGYNEIIKKGTNPEVESKILDKNTTTDNVIDLTDVNNISEELKQTNSEYIKVKDNVYLKLDLSNPDSVKKLLSDLKENILSQDGQKVLAGFNYVSFSEETGITIQSITQAKRLTVSNRTESPKGDVKEIPIETQKLYQAISNERDIISKTPEKEKVKLAEEKSQLNTDLLKLVDDPSMKEDINQLLNLPKENLSKAQTKTLMDIVDKYKNSGTLKDLLLTFNTLSPEKNLNELIKNTPESKIKHETLELLDKTTKELLPNNLNIVALPINKESFGTSDAISQLDKLAKKHPEIKELLDKLDSNKATGKSLKLMGINKEDLALYLTTGQSNPKMEIALQKAFKTGNWPSVISSLEITRLHRTALQDRIIESKEKISSLFSDLGTAKTSEEQAKIKKEIFAFSDQINQIESMIEADTSLLKTLPDSATRARTSVSKRAIAIFDSQLAKLKPDSPEYAKIKKSRDNEVLSLNNDAHALDERIDKTEAKGKKVSTDLKGMASNIHGTAASSDISMFGIESVQKQKGAGAIADPKTPPPASELLKTAEKHIEKIEKYTPNPNKDLGIQELRLTLNQSQRQDSKDRLQATDVFYDEKTKTFKYNIPSDYKPANESSVDAKPTYSSSGPLTSSLDNKPTQVITEQQKEIEKEYHVSGIKALGVIEKEKQILTSQLTTGNIAPKDPIEAKKQIEIVKKLSSLETTASDIKIEQSNVVRESKKIDNEVNSLDSSLNSKSEQYTQKTKQKEDIAAQIKTLNQQLEEMKVEQDDLKGSTIFNNPEKQKQLEKEQKHGESALILLNKEYERLEKEENKLVPFYSSDEPNSESISATNERLRVSGAKKEISDSQVDALKQAYIETRNLDPKASSPEVLIANAKKGIEEGKKVFTNAPEWMKQKPEFKVEEVRYTFGDNIRQRSDLSESIELFAADKAKNQYLSSSNPKEDKSLVESKADKAGNQAGLKEKQDWDIGTVKDLDKSEAIRVSLNSSPEITKDQKQELAIESIKGQVLVSKDIAKTIPEETLRILGRSYETAEFEISPDLANASGIRPLQVDLMESIGQATIESVGISFRREMVFKGQKPIDKDGVAASQNLLNLTSMIADTLIKKNGGREGGEKLKDVKQKWDVAIKDIEKQADEHKENLKKEKTLVLGALDYQIYRTKEAASGHSLAATIWDIRDVIENDDPNNKKAKDFDYDKIDLTLLDKARANILKKYDNQIIQLSAFSADFHDVAKGNRPLEYLSGLKLFAQSDSTDKISQDIAKQVVTNHKGNVNMDLILKPNPSNWDPTFKNWIAKSSVSEKGAGIREEAKSLEERTGTLLSGGYQKEINEAKQMEGRYAAMSVTDVFGVDTEGWEIETDGLKWLNTVGSVLNKTDTVAMIAEIALTEVLTAGLGSAVATARVAMFLEKVAANYPRVEQAIALVRSISAIAPSILSGEKNAANALRLVGSVAKSEGLAIRTMSGMRRLEQLSSVGANTSRFRTFVNGSTHMAQVIAVQNGLNLAAQKTFGEHALATKFVEFTGQFLFVNSSSKFSGIKDFSGRLAMNFALMYGQEHTSSLVSYGIEKAMEVSNGGPLTAAQKFEAKKWGERVSMAAGIVVPSLIGALHTQKMPPEKIKELSSFHTEKLNTGLPKDSPEYKKINDAFSSYFKENSKESLKLLQESVKMDKIPPQAKEATTKFIKEEAAKLALKEMPKIETNDPKVYSEHIEKHLNELNGKDGLPKYDAETINKIVSQEFISKSVEGISKINVDFDNLNGAKGAKVALEESQHMIDTIKQRKEQLLDKLKDIPSFKPEEVKELVDTSMKMTLEELTKNKALNKDSLFTIAKAAEQIETPLVIKISPEEGLPAQEFSVKLV
ncbi:MAG: hypothetical protein AABZ74_04420, partial [Cyanobacteriota bacterium]